MPSSGKVEIDAAREFLRFAQLMAIIVGISASCTLLQSNPKQSAMPRVVQMTATDKCPSDCYKMRVHDRWTRGKFIFFEYSVYAADQVVLHSVERQDRIDMLGSALQPLSAEWWWRFNSEYHKHTTPMGAQPPIQAAEREQ